MTPKKLFLLLLPTIRSVLSYMWTPLLYVKVYHFFFTGISCLIVTLILKIYCFSIKLSFWNYTWISAYVNLEHIYTGNSIIHRWLFDLYSSELPKWRNLFNGHLFRRNIHVPEFHIYWYIIRCGCQSVQCDQRKYMFDKTPLQNLQFALKRLLFTILCFAWFKFFLASFMLTRKAFGDILKKKLLTFSWFFLSNINSHSFIVVNPFKYFST